MYWYDLTGHLKLDLIKYFSTYFKHNWKFIQQIHTADLFLLAECQRYLVYILYCDQNDMMQHCCSWIPLHKAITAKKSEGLMRSMLILAASFGNDLIMLLLIGLGQPQRIMWVCSNMVFAMDKLWRAQKRYMKCAIAISTFYFCLVRWILAALCCWHPWRG